MKDKPSALGILMARSAASDPLGFVDSMLDVLFRIIPIIHPALSADREARAISIVLPDEEEFKQICSAKLTSLFPELTSQLLTRLVLASLQRRRFFYYAATYNLKFQSDVQQEPHSVVSDKPFSPPMPAFGDTHLGAASSFVSQADSNLDPFSQPLAENSDTISLMSIAKSHHEMKYQMPPFPADSEGGLRECVACHLTLPLPTEHIWR